MECSVKVNEQQHCKTGFICKSLMFCYYSFVGVIVNLENYT